MRTDTAYSKFTEELVGAMERNNDVIWHKEWIAFNMGNRGYGNSNPYRGGNAPFAEAVRQSRGYGSRQWLTFYRFIELQKKNPGMKMKSGSTSIPVIDWAPRFLKDANGCFVLDSNGNRILDGFSRICYNVFNADCFEGFDFSKTEPKAPEILRPAEKEKAEDYMTDLMKSYVGCPTVIFDASDRAYYSRATDSIHLQPMSTFRSVGSFVTALAHEMIHSTGIARRLGRKCLETYSPEDKSRNLEELVAEIGASMICFRLGLLPEVLENNAAYIASWSKALRDNPSWFHTAYGMALKAAALVLGEKCGEAEAEEQQAA